MLHNIDLAIIIVYLLTMVIVGIASRGRQADASDYFTGGFSRTLTVGLVGLSIAATFFSGISFLAYPSVIYSNGIAILLGLLLIPISWVVVAYWFIPRFMRTGARQPYQMIEDRFGYPTRAVAAGMFVMLRIGWMGTLIYAPTIAIMAVYRLPESYFWPIVLALGITSTLYTTLGGIRGVIVTDAIQLIVISLGVLFPVIYVLTHLPVSVSDAWDYLAQRGHLNPVNLSLSFREPLTLWSVVLGVTVANLGMYMADQMSLQRYLTARDLSSARRAFAVNLIGVAVVIVLLALVGLSMTIWYGLTPGAVPPQRPDEVFPAFVMTHLPTGVPGLIIAAILAATMSSMTSGINSLAGTLTLDFASRSRWLGEPKRQLWFGRGASLLIGLCATGVAGVVAQLGTIFEIAQMIGGLFAGPLLVCVVLSLVSLRVSSASVIAGMLAGALAGFLVIRSGAYGLWVAPAAAASSLLIPLLAAAVGPAHAPGEPTAPATAPGQAARDGVARFAEQSQGRS